MWSLTKRVKSVREDNREVLPWQAVYPHDGLAQCLFSVGLAVAEKVTEAFTSKSWFFSIVSSGWTVEYGDGTRLSSLTTLRVRLLSPLLTCPSLHVYSPFCFCPFPPSLHPLHDPSQVSFTPVSSALCGRGGHHPDCPIRIRLLLSGTGAQLLLWRMEKMKMGYLQSSGAGLCPWH